MESELIIYMLKGAIANYYYYYYYYYYYNFEPLSK